MPSDLFGVQTSSKEVKSIKMVSLSPWVMTREDREDCWAEWKEAQTLLRLRRDEFYAEMRATHVGRWRDWVKENDEMIERIRDRIEAKTQKIARLEERNEELERKIAEVEG